MRDRDKRDTEPALPRRPEEPVWDPTEPNTRGRDVVEGGIAEWGVYVTPDYAARAALRRRRGGR